MFPRPLSQSTQTCIWRTSVITSHSARSGILRLLQPPHHLLYRTYRNPILSASSVPLTLLAQSLCFLAWQAKWNMHDMDSQSAFADAFSLVGFLGLMYRVSTTWNGGETCMHDVRLHSYLTAHSHITFLLAIITYPRYSHQSTCLRKFPHSGLHSNIQVRGGIPVLQPHHLKSWPLFPPQKTPHPAPMIRPAPSPSKTAHNTAR